MGNEYEKKILEGLDEISDKISDRTLWDGDNANLIRKLLFEEQSRMHNASRKIGRCICPNCSNTSIRKSHTIPRGMSLDIIAENKKVVTPTFIERYPVNEQFIGIKETGIGLASTFPGFCKEHELLFQSYEKKESINKGEDVVKQLYRNVAYNCFLVEKRIELGEHIINRYGEARNQAAYNYLKRLDFKRIVKRVQIVGEDEAIKYLIYHRQELIDFHSKLEKYKVKLWKIMNGSDKDIVIRSAVIDVMFPVCICGCMEIVLDDQTYLCSVDVVPNEKETLITIGFCGEVSPELYDAVDSRLNHPLAILNFIESIMVYGTDNWYLSPKVWKMLSDRRKEKLLSEMQKLKMSIFDEVPYSIFDENRKSLITVLSFEGECAEHELKKMET